MGLAFEGVRFLAASGEIVVELAVWLANSEEGVPAGFFEALVPSAQAETEINSRGAIINARNECVKRRFDIVIKK